MIYSKWQKELFKRGQICSIALRNFKWITVDKRIMDGGVVISLVLRCHSKGRETRLIEDERHSLLIRPLSRTTCSFSPPAPLSLHLSILISFFSIPCFALNPPPLPPTYHKKDLMRWAWCAQCQLEEASTEARTISVILGLTSLRKKSH